MYVIIRRFLEFALIEVLISAVVTALFHFEILPSTGLSIFFTTACGAILYFVSQFFLLRHCFVCMRIKGPFYLYNSIAYAIFALVSVIIYEFIGNFVFTWSFSITKMAHFFYTPISISLSVAIFHTLVLILIFVAPMGMEWIFLFDEDE